MFRKSYAGESWSFDNKKYEEVFKEFYRDISPVLKKVTSYKMDPLSNPHNFSFELLQEMELLHMKLSEALYRLRYGELQEKLDIKEININEFDILTKELDNIDKLYRNI